MCAAGAHAVARYAKLPVLFQPRACVPHAPYSLHDKINQLVIGDFQKGHEIGGGGVAVEEKFGIAHGFPWLLRGMGLPEISGSLI